MANLHYLTLRDKWISKHSDLQKKLWEKHGSVIQDFIDDTKQLAVGALSGIMLLSSPVANLLPVSSVSAKEAQIPDLDKSVFLIADLSRILPSEVRPLSNDEERKIGDILSQKFDLKIFSELEGIRLDRSYGYIGAEQHLMRYPGDNADSHFENFKYREEFQSSGLAPGLGAWGYWAKNRESLTQDDIDQEKYYIAAQTFLAPGFHDNVRKYITFFKYRKMILVNPNNGRAMVVVVGDAGPARWTGKHLGGSPEVMRYLERVDGAQKGPVLYYFIDDPENKIPLGPIEVK